MRRMISNTVLKKRENTFQCHVAFCTFVAFSKGGKYELQQLDILPELFLSQLHEIVTNSFIPHVDIITITIYAPYSGMTEQIYLHK